MADSEKYFTKLVDGQLSVATVAQSGEIIPEESRPGDKYTTALVQTDEGPQLCVKTYDLNGGGGGGGTVDQTYDPTSTNAQSGTAVAEAVAPALKNTATGSNSLTILGTPATSNYGLNIGANTSVGSNGSTAVGANARAGEYGTAVGGGNASNNSAVASSYASTAIGSSAEAGGSYSTAIGKSSLARGKRSVCLGASANDYYNERCTLVGYNSQAGANYAIAIGAGASATAEGAIQIGNTSTSLLTNAHAKTLQVYEYQLLDGNTGLIPPERLGTGYDATKTQVLKNINGVLTWVEEA